MNLINQMKRFKLLDNSKNPSYEWKKTNRHLWTTGHRDSNSGIPCGSVNNLTVIDLDFYKIEGRNHFTERFNNMIDLFDTLTVKTANGGYHLYFQYDESIQTTTNQKYNIDIRNDGSYVVSPGSKIDGREYTVVHDQPIKPMNSDIRNWLLDNLYTIDRKPNKRQPTERATEFDILYNLTPAELDQIIRSLPDKYWSNDQNNFFKYTTFCKYFNQYDLWDELNKTHDGYDQDNNLKCYWNTAQPTEQIIDSILTEEHINYCKYKTTKKNIIRPNKIINRNKLGFDLIDSTDQIIQSDTGTGKTTAFKHYVKQNNLKFISIVSRISLADEQYNIFSEHGIGCKNYKISDDLNNGDSIIITIDSIRKLYNIDFHNYVIFLDEYNSLLQYLITANTLSKNRSILYKRFIQIIQKCNQVIATDADINDISINWLRTYKEPVTYIQNTYKHNRNVMAYELNNFDHLIDRLKSENKFMLCCDSKTNAELIYKQLNDPSICLIIGGDDTYYKLDDHDKVIFSPKIMYGIDSSMKRNVYCYYREQTIQPTGYLQQIARCRQINILYYLFDRKKYKHSPLTFDDIQYQTYQQNILGCRYFKDEVDINQYIVYQDLLNKYQYNDYCYESNKFAHFRSLLIERGFIIDLNNKFLKVSDKKITELKKELKADKIDQFDVNKYPTIHKILQVPEEHQPTFIEMYIDQYKLNKHFNLITMAHQTTSEIKFKLSDNMDYNVNKITIDRTKILYLKKLKSYIDTNQSFESFVVNKEISTADRKILFEEYNIIFRNRSVKKTFSLDCHILEYQAKIYKVLFGDDLICSKKTKLSKDATGKRKNGIIYTIDQDVMNKHNLLYSFRKVDHSTCLF